MLCSDARLAANRRNAELSTGPKTAEGKERSRGNGLKHGLTGAGIVVPEGDREEIARRVEALEADMKPRSPAGAILILRMATLSVRMERAGERETAAMAKRVRHAVDDFDEERFDEADRLHDALGEDPRRNLRKLRKMPEGVELLLESWRELRDDLTRDTKPAWTAAHLERAANMIGVKVENARGSRIGVLSRGVWGDFHALGDREGGNLAEEARQEWARARLAERIDAEIAGLEAHRETLDFAMIELDRAESPTRALFDSSKEETLARRYEAAAERGFFKALKEFHRVEAESAARSEEDPSLPPSPDQACPAAGMGSPWESTSPADSDPAWTFLHTPMEADPVVRGADGQPLSLSRPAKTPG